MRLENSRERASASAKFQMESQMELKQREVEEERLKTFFSEQVRLIFESSSRDPEGFLAYFARREPRDEEILCLLAVSSMVRSPADLGDYPAPAEALAALSGASRSEICSAFRTQLQDGFRRAVLA